MHPILHASLLKPKKKQLQETSQQVSNESIPLIQASAQTCEVKLRTLVENKQHDSDKRERDLRGNVNIYTKNRICMLFLIFTA